MLELRQLRYFVMVAELEHVGRAAKALNLTQSPLSRQIMDLEAKLGLELFHREKKRIRLSSTGRDFLHEAKMLLAQADKLSRYAEALAAGQSGTLIVGYVDGALHAGLLSSTLKAIKSTHPALRIHLRPMRSRDQFQKLVSGEIDIALTYSAPLNSASVRAYHILTEDYLLAVPATLGWVSPIKASRLNNQPFIWLPSSSYPAEKSKLEEACANCGFHPDISLEATSPLAALDLVSADVGLALVQSSLRKLSPPNVVFFEMPKSFKKHVKIYAVHRLNKTQIEDSFLSELRSTTV